MQKNKIIVFANSKGGVGKSLLCALFANFLAEHRIKVRVVDMDVQKSILTKRQTDLKGEREQENPNDKAKGKLQDPYVVSTYNHTPNSRYEDYYNHLRYSDDFDVVLIDTPGQMPDGWVGDMLISADLVIVPFKYEGYTLAGTIKFFRALIACGSLNAEERDKSLLKVACIPNFVKSNTGTKSEKETWKFWDDYVSKFADILPPVHETVELERFNTLFFLKKQKNYVSEAFKKCCELIGIELNKPIAPINYSDYDDE